MRPFTNRRGFGGALVAAAGALAVRRLCSSGFVKDRWKPQSRAAILHEDSYSGRLDQVLMEGLRLFELNLRGKTVLLKPNLVEYIPGAEVNTNPRLVGAAADALLALGAKTVLVGEGPGHQRDTVLVLAEGGLEAELRERRIRFVDLNRDEIRKVPLQTPFTGLDCLWLPRTVLTSDFIVSMPKVKTHHWAGVTLSMKNLFGVVPGVAYGWPKKPAALEGDRPKHPGYQRRGSGPFRDCRRDYWHGGQRAAAWHSAESRADRVGRRSSRGRFHMHPPDGAEPVARELPGPSGRVSWQRIARAHRAIERKAAIRDAALRGSARVCSPAPLASVARNSENLYLPPLEWQTGTTMRDWRRKLREFQPSPLTQWSSRLPRNLPARRFRLVFRTMRDQARLNLPRAVSQARLPSSGLAR